MQCSGAIRTTVNNNPDNAQLTLVLVHTTTGRRLLTNKQKRPRSSIKACRTAFFSVSSSNKYLSFTDCKWLCSCFCLSTDPAYKWNRCSCCRAKARNWNSVLGQGPKQSAKRQLIQLDGDLILNKAIAFYFIRFVQVRVTKNKTKNERKI